MVVNRQMCVTDGVARIMQIGEAEQFLEKEFDDFAIGYQHFPSLFQLGVADSAVHSSGVSYLLSLGLECGIPAIAEYPVSIHAIDPWKQLGRVRPDSIWFHPKTHQPWLAFEFERFERGDENKIRGKVENLILSYHQSQKTIELCVFIYWLRSSLAPRSIAPIFNTISKGFQKQGQKVPPPGCKFFVYKMVFTDIKTSSISRAKGTKEQSTGYYIPNSTRLIVQEVRKINDNR
jgi:hypothetical protein